MVKAAFLAIYLIWGLNWVIMKEANMFFPPVMFVAYRFAIGAVVLLCISLWRRLPVPPRKYWKWIIITGVLQTVVNNLAAQVGLRSLDVGLVAVLNYSMPVWVAILAHFFLNEYLTVRKIVGIVVSMVGLFILMNVTALGNIGAIFLVLIGALAWAVANVVVKLQNRVMQENQVIGANEECSVLQYTTWQMISGALLLFLYMGVVDQGSAQWNWASVACLAYNGIIASAGAFLLWNYVLINMEVSKATIAVLAVPCVGVTAGVLILGEPLRWTTALGMVMILGGVLLIVTQKHNKLKEKNILSKS